ncbi:MAG: hypothetical protein E6307_16560 [Klebsiella pneumoniae]|nr:hypothetical protein [Klebsiella pneumoniae]
MPPTLAAFSFLTLHIFSDYADYKQACRSECPVVTVGAELNSLLRLGLFVALAIVACTAVGLFTYLVVAALAE